MSEITSEILNSSEVLDTLINTPATRLGTQWHDIWADTGSATPTGWTHNEGEEFSTARWWRYGFPGPAFVGITFAANLSTSQEFKFILMDDKVGNWIEMKVAYNTSEQYFVALVEEDNEEAENVLWSGFVPRVEGDRFYFSVEEGVHGVQAWRKTGEGAPTVFGQGTLVVPFSSFGRTLDIELFHTGSFRATNFTAGSLNPEPPIIEETTNSTLVALNYSNWGAEANADLAKAVKFVRFDEELGVKTLQAVKSLGLKIHMLFPGPYNEGGVSALNPDKWVENALEFYKANLTPVEAPIVEVLNEPGGPWFWGAEANSAANSLAYRTLMQKTYKAFHAQYGSSSPKIIGSVEGNGLQFGEQWWIPECATFVDGVVVHPYGGTGEKSESALGNRKRVEEARELTGRLVYLTEAGWPTAIEKESTPDSLQWTEEEQAANIKDFFTWARSTHFVAEVVIFAFHDFGTRTWYGVVRLDGSHKPAYDVMKEEAEIYAEEIIDKSTRVFTKKLIEITDEFMEPNGEWEDYSSISSQNEALREQKHVDIRSFVSKRLSALVTMFFMDRITMSQMNGAEISTFTSDSSPPARIIIVNNEGWSFGTVEPQSDRNNWNGITVVCDPEKSSITTTQSVITQNG